jgi:hypothetical protein
VQDILENALKERVLESKSKKEETDRKTVN